jgi:hypothetical protein
VDGQLQARPTGPGRLYLCLNRGSEAFEVGPSGPKLLERRVASPEEDAALTRAAGLVAERLRRSGLEVQVVSSRLNRRKLDLIPEPEWRDPPKARIAELVTAVEERLRACGLTGLPAVVELARAAAVEAGLAEARVTSDAKHVEIGLTDKADSARWLLGRLWLHGIGPRSILVAGDELGPLGGVAGSDSHLLVPETQGATVVSVGIEPQGVPPGVIGLGGGPDAFLELLRDQVQRRERGELPLSEGDPGWTLRIEGLDPELERAHESLLTIRRCLRPGSTTATGPRRRCSSARPGPGLRASSERPTSSCARSTCIPASCGRISGSAGTDSSPRRCCPRSRARGPSRCAPPGRVSSCGTAFAPPG